ncbi:hypothetical protein [Acinetobacter towneri]|uniref:hypothetical protein n=1 Tax=Acinetobacter towneri TaxID=202956 RepID=UPI0002CFBFA1|nr:hypothetical protein [Acinetobacter towneri]ENV70718.1 hypothetical protein F947_00724 [Acinetobacter towneri DSM 14962 = CIP 107472]
MWGYRPLLTCMLGSCLLVGCGDRPSSKETGTASNNQAISQRVTFDTRPVLIPGDQLPPFEIVNDDIPYEVDLFSQYLHRDLESKELFKKLRQDLKLSADELLIVGNREPLITPQNQGFFLGSHPEEGLFTAANKVVIDHVRLLKKYNPTERQPTESTQIYQQRILQERQQHEKVTSNMQVDLGRLEDALNFYTHRGHLPDNDGDVAPSYYDPDRQIMHLKYPNLHYEDSYDSEGLLEILSVEFRLVPAEAEKLLKMMPYRAPSLGFVYGVKDGRLTLLELVLYSFEKEIPFIITTIQPTQFKRQFFRTKDDQIIQPAVSSQNFTLHKPFQFQFGIKSYGAKPKAMDPKLNELAASEEDAVAQENNVEVEDVS